MSGTKKNSGLTTVTSRGPTVPRLDKKPCMTFEKKGDWSTMTAERWHDSMYSGENSYFWQLWKDTIQYTLKQAAAYCGGAEKAIHVEVGSGTGDVILGSADAFSMSIGVDINKGFLKYSNDHTPQSVQHKVKFIEGSATELMDTLGREAPGYRKHPVVVSCVNNTIGIFPDEIKPATYQQMMEAAGETGIVIVGFWNANWFGDALQHFYYKHPELCGHMIGADIDWRNSTLITKDGYKTHWTTPEEAREVLERYGFDVVEVKELGKGVLCTCRGKKVGTPLKKTAPGFRTRSASQELLREVEKTSAAFYDDAFAQYFYREIWGGKHQHVGLYDSPALDTLAATQRVISACDDAIRKLFAMAPPLLRGSKVIEFGSGFGATARYAATTFGARVSCIDLSAKANEINRSLTSAANLSHLVHVPRARSFFETGEPAATYAMVCSQDALCHAADQTPRALAEAARVLVPGGYLVCTNIMKDSQAQDAEMVDVLARLKLTAMETPESFIAHAKDAGFDLVEYEDCTDSLITHYATVNEVLDSKREDLLRHTSEDYLESVTGGLDSWEDAGNNGILRWGYFVFHKRVKDTRS